MKRCFTLKVRKSPNSFVLLRLGAKGSLMNAVAHPILSPKFRQLRVTNGVSFDRLISAAGQRFKKRSVMSPRRMRLSSYWQL
jgi:hypothetical protein